MCEYFLYKYKKCGDYSFYIWDARYQCAAAGNPKLIELGLEPCPWGLRKFKVLADGGFCPQCILDGATRKLERLIVSKRHVPDSQTNNVEVSVDGHVRLPQRAGDLTTEVELEPAKRITRRETR